VEEGLARIIIYHRLDLGGEARISDNPMHLVTSTEVVATSFHLLHQTLSA
jgi:hypothetical protein